MGSNVHKDEERIQHSLYQYFYQWVAKGVGPFCSHLVSQRKVVAQSITESGSQNQPRKFELIEIRAQDSNNLLKPKVLSQVST